MPDTQAPVFSLRSWLYCAVFFVALRTIEVIVHRLDAQIEVLDRGPHRARADLVLCNSSSRKLPARDRWQGSRWRLAGGAVIKLAVCAVQRGLPVRVPEVLVGGVGAPRGRQVIAAGCVDDVVA